jgi:lysophospholipase L1-like esterase
MARMRPVVAGLCASLPLLWLVAPARAQIKISAIGASTTQGSGAPAGQSYPDQLQKLLGPGYQVRNFGKSGAGALRAGNPTYWNSAEQRAAAAFAPDIVINWLGGADSKAASWDAHKGEFLGDYKAMIKYFQDLPSQPKIISLMSIALRDDAGVRKAILEAEVNPLQRQGALEMGSRFIDTKSIVDGHPEYFADGVHLRASGYAAIAKAVETEVRALATAADGGAAGDGSAADGMTGVDAGADVAAPSVDAPVMAVDTATMTPPPPGTSNPGADAAAMPAPGTRRDAAGMSPPTSYGGSNPGGCAVGGDAPAPAAALALMLTAITLARFRQARRARRLRPAS